MIFDQKIEVLRIKRHVTNTPLLKLSLKLVPLLFLFKKLNLSILLEKKYIIITDIDKIMNTSEFRLPSQPNPLGG